MKTQIEQAQSAKATGGVKSNPFVASLNAAPACQTPDKDTDWFPAVDVTKTGQEYLLEVDLPELKPQEIQLSADSAGPSISGQQVPKPQGALRVRFERASGAVIPATFSSASLGSKPRRGSLELFAIWSYVGFSFAALFFALYVIWAKCQGNWHF